MAETTAQKHVLSSGGCVLSFCFSHNVPLGGGVEQATDKYSQNVHQCGKGNWANGVLGGVYVSIDWKHGALVGGMVHYVGNIAYIRQCFQLIGTTPPTRAPVAQ